MPRAKEHTAEEIIAKLREAELAISQGRTAAQAAKKIGVTEQTYYRWRKEYGGLRTDQARRLRDLEKENARLKKLLAESELDKAILKEAASGSRADGQTGGLFVVPVDSPGGRGFEAVDCFLREVESQRLPFGRKHNWFPPCYCGATL
jgi:transposase-like protein